MKFVRFINRFLKLLYHVCGGLIVVHYKFPKFNADEKSQAIINWSQQALRILDINLHVQGNPWQGPVLYTANHVSWLDILAMLASCNCHFVSKAQIRYWPLIGTLTRAADTLFVERTNRRHTMHVVHNVRDALLARKSIAVFPEGTTSDGFGLLPFHANFLQAAIAAQMPAQVVALRYTQQIQEQWIKGKANEWKAPPASTIVRYVGNDTLLVSLWRILSANQLSIWVHYGKVEHANGRDRRKWMADLKQQMHDLLDI